MGPWALGPGNLTQSLWDLRRREVRALGMDDKSLTGYERKFVKNPLGPCLKAGEEVEVQWTEPWCNAPTTFYGKFAIGLKFVAAALALLIWLLIVTPTLLGTLVNTIIFAYQFTVEKVTQPWYADTVLLVSFLMAEA